MFVVADYDDVGSGLKWGGVGCRRRDFDDDIDANGNESITIMDEH